MRSASRNESNAIPIFYAQARSKRISRKISQVVKFKVGQVPAVLLVWLLHISRLFF